MDDFDPEDDGRRVADEAAADPSDFLQLMGHLYRGELGRTTSWRARIDRTTNWAVVITATLLTWAFSGGDRPHYVILVGMVMVATFLVVEARRYRIYDVWRSRVRMLEENVFAEALAPDGVQHRAWRTLLSEDLREPTVKTPIREALARRLRRIHLPLLLVLLVAWLVHLAAFGSDAVVADAAIARVPGAVVVAAVGAAYAGVVLLAVWPMPRRAKGELDRDEDVAAEWKD